MISGVVFVGRNNSYMARNTKKVHAGYSTTRVNFKFYQPVGRQYPIACSDLLYATYSAARRTFYSTSYNKPELPKNEYAYTSTPAYTVDNSKNKVSVEII